MELIFSISLIHLMACLSPGPDIFLVIRNSLRNGSLSGVYTTLGILTGVVFQITLGLTGISYLLTRGPMMQNGIALAGGTWLVYLGGKGLWHMVVRPVGDSPETVRNPHPDSVSGYWREGLLVNLLNPKALLFFLSLFSVMLGPDVPIRIKLACGGSMVVTQLLAFSAVAALAGHRRFKSRMPAVQKWLDRGFSLLLVGLGAWIWIAVFIR